MRDISHLTDDERELLRTSMPTSKALEFLQLLGLRVNADELRYLRDERRLPRLTVEGRQRYRYQDLERIAPELRYERMVRTQGDDA